jgi:RND family efflux transporter MFP subunit
VTRTGSADLSGLRLERDAPAEGDGSRRYRTRFFLLVGAIVLIVAGVISYGALRPHAVVVTVAPAEALGGRPGSAASEILTANGYVVARQRAAVSTEVSGRLGRLFVEEGSRVRKGDVLGVLQNDEQRAAVENARAALHAAEAAVAEARANAREAGLTERRTRELLAKGLASQADHDDAEARAKASEARVQSAEAEVGRARAGLDAAQVAYERTFIRAPFAGAILRKEAEVGEVVTPIPSTGGLTRGAIVTMANLETVEVEVDVNEGYVARVHEGMHAEIVLDAYPDERFPGRVRQIVPTADRQKATVLVKVAFDKHEPRALPEMGVRVTFLADAEPAPGAGGPAAHGTAVSLPREAVREVGGSTVVFVVEGGRASMRAVSPRPLAGDRVSVGGGLAPGELVVVGGPPNLKDRDRVKVR